MHLVSTLLTSLILLFLFLYTPIATYILFEPRYDSKDPNNKNSAKGEFMFMCLKVIYITSFSFFKD